ncbi:carbonic anhydrase [Anabaena sp. WFMT]|uniref:carbonic anhydrase n=1 Tax=Anabaena sp. WFMT TaxID=3449730 RepID=UPI003F27F48D
MSRINGFVGRRNFLKLVGLSSLSIGTIIGCNSIISDREQITIPETNPNPNPVTANEAQRRLIAGNKRFINQNRQYPNQSQRRIQSVAREQYPIAAILGCADSRVPPEIIFDQGLGDLFVVRVAGNVASTEAIGSLEYSTANLGTELIVVLGHKRCGAVAKAMKNERISGNIGVVVDGIKPSLDQNQQRRDNFDDVDGNENDQQGTDEVDDNENDQQRIDDVDGNNNAEIANIRYQTEKIQKNSVVLDRLIRAGRLKIVSAFYDIDTGKVNFIEQNSGVRSQNEE